MVQRSRPARGAAAALAVAVCLGAPACTRDVTFEPVDLGRVVSTPDEAPPGIIYSPKLSGSLDLESYEPDAADRSMLAHDGFRASFEAVFASPDLLDFLVLSKPGARAPAHTTLVTSSAVVFSDSGGAARALPLLRRRAMSGMTSAPHPLASEEFGDGAFAFQGSDLEGHEIVAYGWRIGNLCQVVRSEGPVDPSDILFMARNMRRRAQDSA
jgi:hypothetical protein